MFVTQNFISLDEFVTKLYFSTHKKTKQRNYEILFLGFL